MAQCGCAGPGPLWVRQPTNIRNCVFVSSMQRNRAQQHAAISEMTGASKPRKAAELAETTRVMTFLEGHFFHLGRTGPCGMGGG